MRKATVILGVFALATLVSCKEKASEKIDEGNVAAAAQRDEASKSLPAMTFEEAEFDFGTIEQGTPQEHTFVFTNTGDAPLIITNATSSCGCTVPDYPKNVPIQPGEKGQLVVKFNGSGLNQVMKTVTLSTNTAKGQEMLRIKAFVQAKDGASASLGPVAN
ncbi:DUF1573 domain-containing protein [Robiginitalea marina]|uniref:DUF1573 domain-containing protein n=1 Tax=Robiginitalea marina TaxID=2954105 RepID=A0ABT1AVG9_9FLAO|nr:DUF1573 domain-containing protein [Robiginitalea marina]MCO5724054.1 DUF1573 domain-containing protein [Robiginitalea marina]